MAFPKNKKRKVVFQKISAKEIMSEVVVKVEQNTSVSDVAHLMLRDRISGLPVVDKKKKVVGMLTLTDLFKMINDAAGTTDKDFYEQILFFRKRRVCEIMSRNVYAISPHTTLDKMLHLLLEKSIHSFPVVRAGKLIGIVGRHDILNAVFTFC